MGIHGPIRNIQNRYGFLVKRNSTSRIFWSKSGFFLIYVLKDPHDSGDHFHTKISVVGCGCVGGKREKLIKKSKKLQLSSDVVDDVTLMNHT